MRVTLALVAALGLVAAPAAAQDTKPTKPAKPAKKAEAAGQKRREIPDSFQIGKPVDFTLKDIDGNTYRMRDYLGKIVVLDFWSIDCPISKGYEERLKAIHDDYRDKGVVVLAMNPNNREVQKKAEDPYRRIRKYVKKAEVPYPILIDEDARIAKRFGAKFTPHVYILDRKGNLAYAGGIDDDFQWRVSRRGGEPQENARNAIEDLLADREVKTARTDSWGCTIKWPKQRREKTGGGGADR